MKIVETIQEMRKWSEEQKCDGEKIIFVPTMGALHEGHLSLLREGKKHGGKLVLSIYVNPTQFAPGEDFEKYPKNLDADSAMAEKCGVDIIFAPECSKMYPEGYQTFVEVEKITNMLCGKARPSHFKGVTTVVAKLFNIVRPDIAIFGKKDFQQLVIIKRMAQDLNMDIEIIGYPIVRENDGLAMSSRNKYLNHNERIAAASINKSLRTAQKMIEDGETNATAIVSRIESIIEESGIPRIDYISIADPQTLEDVDKITRPALIAIAAFVGKARLIDNLHLK